MMRVDRGKHAALRSESRTCMDACIYGLKSLRENSILSRKTALRVRKILCFVSGHDFSRAIKIGNMPGFRACVRTRFCLRRQLYGLRKSSVLYQGTTLVVPRSALVPAPDFSPGERAFSRGNVPVYKLRALALVYVIFYSFKPNGLKPVPFRIFLLGESFFGDPFQIRRST